MGKFSNKTLSAIYELANHADSHGLRIVRADRYKPKGEKQDCGIAGVKHEWVKQSGGGFTGDDFHGTVTWKIGDFYVIAYY